MFNSWNFRPSIMQDDNFQIKIVPNNLTLRDEEFGKEFSYECFSGALSPFLLTGTLVISLFAML